MNKLPPFVVDNTYIEMFAAESALRLQQIEPVSGLAKTEEWLDWLHRASRIMHTIKGSSGMLGMMNIYAVSRELEHLLSDAYAQPLRIQDASCLNALIIEGIGCIRNELTDTQRRQRNAVHPGSLMKKIANYRQRLEDARASTPMADAAAPAVSYQATIRFFQGSEIENIVTFNLIRELSKIAARIQAIPGDLADQDGFVRWIREHGYRVRFDSNRSHEDIYSFFAATIIFKKLELQLCE